MNATKRTIPAWWRLQRADDCVIATAIHDGTLLRPEVEAAIALDATTRLREEDPFTGQAVAGVPTHVVPLRSRFEVDLNRAEDDAVYLRPEQSWGLRVWRAPPPGELVETSLRMHRAFYAMLAQLLDEVVATHGRFLLLDVRENVAFQGRGQLARFVHERYPVTGCSLAVEFKKFYMDEWTGEPDPVVLPAMRDFITHAADAGRALLRG